MAHTFEIGTAQRYPRDTEQPLAGYLIYMTVQPPVAPTAPEITLLFGQPPAGFTGFQNTMPTQETSAHIMHIGADVTQDPAIARGLAGQFGERLVRLADGIDAGALAAEGIASELRDTPMLPLQPTPEG